MEANSNNWQRRNSTFVKTEMRHFWWFLSTVRAMEQLITQQIWTFYQSKHQPRLLQRGCKPQTSSQITDYCVAQKKRDVRKSRFSSGLGKKFPCFYPWGGIGTITAWKCRTMRRAFTNRWRRRGKLGEGKRVEIDNSFFLPLAQRASNNLDTFSPFKWLRNGEHFSSRICFYTTPYLVLLYLSF